MDIGEPPGFEDLIAQDGMERSVRRMLGHARRNGGADVGVAQELARSVLQWHAAHDVQHAFERWLIAHAEALHAGVLRQAGGVRKELPERDPVAQGFELGNHVVGEWIVGLIFLGLAVLIGYSLPHKSDMARFAENDSQPAAPGETAQKAAPAGGGEKDQPAVKAGFTPPDDSKIPDDDFGKMVRLGQAIFHDTQANAKEFVGNDLQCSNCHLKAATQRFAMPFVGVYADYPQYSAREGAVITKGDLKSLKGKKIATSFGTINHLYILGLLEKAGLTPADVTLVNTPPPEMNVALLAKGVDGFVCWDPVPVIGMKDVPGAIEVIRGGDVISYLGFNVALRPWLEKNGETAEKFLAAVSEADQWMRKNPKQAAAIGTRWIPGLKLDVAETAMEYNIQQVDRRISAHNYRALWQAQDTLQRLSVIKSVFDVNKHIEPKHILKVMKDKPQLFADLPPIPADVAIGPGYVFKP